jgi:hypothetical protein
MSVDKVLYENVRKQDADIANVYRDLMKDKPQIDADGIDKLFNQAIADQRGVITDQEAAALSLIVKAGILNNAAKERLNLWLMSEQGMGGLTSGGKMLSSDAELAPVYGALALATAHVQFQSPGTGLAYYPYVYQAMIQLVKNKNIRVVILQDHDLLWDVPGWVAYYDSPSNALLLTSHTTDDFIVHEMTHAVQDWNDIQGVETNFTELDAYIAQGVVVAKKMGPTFRMKTSGPAAHPFAASVNFVLDNPRDAQWNNPKWVSVYKGDAPKYEPTRLANRQPKLADMKLGEKPADHERAKLYQLVADLM